MRRVRVSGARRRPNAAADRRPVVFHRGEQDFALLPVPLLHEVLCRAVPAPEVIAEDGGWTAAEVTRLLEVLGPVHHNPHVVGRTR